MLADNNTPLKIGVNDGLSNRASQVTLETALIKALNRKIWLIYRIVNYLQERTNNAQQFGQELVPKLAHTMHDFCNVDLVRITTTKESTQKIGTIVETNLRIRSLPLAYVHEYALDNQIFSDEDAARYATRPWDDVTLYFHHPKGRPPQAPFFQCTLMTFCTTWAWTLGLTHFRR